MKPLEGAWSCKNKAMLKWSMVKERYPKQLMVRNMQRCRGRPGVVVEVGFKKYLHGVSDAGCRLLRSGTHEKLRRL